MSSILDDVPDRWIEKSLCETATILSGSTPPSETDAYWDGDVVWITPSDLSTLKSPWIESSERMLTKAGRARASLSSIPAGGVVISSRAPIGHIGLAAIELTVNQGCKALVYGNGHDPWFHYYNLLFRMDRIRARGKGTTFAEVSGGVLGRVKMPYPPDREVQAGIARVLGQADDAIDRTRALLSKRQRLHDGLIHTLLTRGIDKRGRVRPFEPGRFEATWLGQLPSEWSTPELGTEATYLSRGRSPVYVERSDHFVLNQACVFPDGLRFDKLKPVSASYWYSLTPERRLQPGDVILNSTGTGTLGRVGYFEGEADTLTFDSHVTIVRVNPERNDSRFLFYELQSTRVQRQVEARCITGSTNQIELSKSAYARVSIARPPLDEQRRIVKALQKSEDTLRTTRTELDKLTRLKFGLMQSLLHGRVRVPAPMPA